MNRVQTILDIVHRSCNKYDGIFRDLEDLEQEVVVKILKYLPETFESDRHFTNWVRLFSTRFVKNSVRDLCNKIDKLKVYNEVDWAPEKNIEKYSCEKWIADNNYQNSLDSVNTSLNLLDTISDQHKSIFLERLELGKQYSQRIAKKFNVTRKTVFNVNRRITQHFRRLKG